MKILSLFDWMACWYEALQRAWIKIDTYYASEIDKYAIQIATKNHPDIIEIWDVCEIKWEDYQDIDLLIWGSPCQWFSVAGKLFFEYVRLLRQIQPKYFLLENVKMKKEWQDIISRELWVEPIEINSSLVSAQNRRRLYRTNIPGITQPKDKWILLKDILEDEVDEKYYLTDDQLQRISNYWKWRNDRAIEHINSEWDEKIWTITSHCWTMSNTMKLISVRGGELRIKQATKQWYIVANDGDGISLAYPNSTTRRGRVIHQKSNTITTEWESYAYSDSIIRKLTPIECERLQTLPDNYTQWVSDTQRYKMLGNGWTVDVISHIFSFIPKDQWHTEN